MSLFNSFTDNICKYPNEVALEFINPPLQWRFKNLGHAPELEVGERSIPPILLDGSSNPRVKIRRSIIKPN
jgi:hypothetical protein